MAKFVSKIEEVPECGFEPWFWLGMILEALLMPTHSSFWQERLGVAYHQKLLFNALKWFYCEIVERYKLGQKQRDKSSGEKEVTKPLLCKLKHILEQFVKRQFLH